MTNPRLPLAELARALERRRRDPRTAPDEAHRIKRLLADYRAAERLGREAKAGHVTPPRNRGRG